jgi:hypothetical protein
LRENETENATATVLGPAPQNDRPNEFLMNFSALSSALSPILSIGVKYKLGAFRLKQTG